MSVLVSISILLVEISFYMILIMNRVYKILTVAVLLGSCSFARTSNNFNSLDSFFEQYMTSSKPIITEERAENDANSLKWKRRHKRRKKAPNRRPKRGK